MSVHIQPRELGATLRCDYHNCPAVLVTGQILVRAIRKYALTVGWIRGMDPGSGDPDTFGRPSNLRADICPEHAVEEKRRWTERNAAKLARQDRRRLRAQMTYEERLADDRAMANAAAKKRRKKRKQQAAQLTALVPAVSA